MKPGRGNKHYKGKLWTLKQVAEYFGVSPQAVYKWITDYNNSMRPFPKPALITPAYKLYSPKEVKSWGRDASKLIPKDLRDK